jgi:two-component system, NtrC family, sensor kinase
VAVPATIEVRGYPMLIHQIVMNLVLNAAEAVEGRGKVLIQARKLESPSVLGPTEIQIEVHDSGPGIPMSAREKVFEAFYTTKPSGSGLGLMSAKSCAEMHGGEVAIDQSHLGGALFKVLVADLRDVPPHTKSELKILESLNKNGMNDAIASTH